MKFSSCRMIQKWASFIFSLDMIFVHNPWVAWQNACATSPPPSSFHLYQSKLYHTFPLLNQASAAFLPWTCSSMSPHSKPWGRCNDQHDYPTTHNKTCRDPDRSRHPKSISSQRTPRKREMTSFLWLSFISRGWVFIFIGPETPKILSATKQKCKGWKLEEAKVHSGGRWQTWLQWLQVIQLSES